MTAKTPQTYPAPAAGQADAGMRASAARFPDSGFAASGFTASGFPDSALPLRPVLPRIADALALLRDGLLLPILLLLRLSGPWAPRT